MTTYLLRVEAVNFDETIFDTDQLSVRRGGGLLLLNAVAALEKKTAAIAGLPESWTKVSAAASIGLFTFETAEAESAEGVRTAVEGWLRNGSLPYKTNEGKTASLPLAVASFVVDVVEMRSDGESDGFADALKRAMAGNRMRQFRQPTVVRWDTDDAVDGVKPPRLFCKFDRIRPATRLLRHGGEDGLISNVVHDRYQYGRAAKQGFYESEAVSDKADVQKVDIGEFDFARELNEIAGEESDREWFQSNGIPLNLLGKMAVIHLDGNGFGKLTSARARVGGESYRQWSDKLRNHHRELLGSLLKRIAEDPTWSGKNGIGRDVRLETLLWGGDEIIWIVPAWKGWELVEWFFGQDHEVDGEDVTYSAGVVFCHAKAPIQRICKVASDLLDAAKGVSKAAVKSESESVQKVGRHAVAYEVLESFDDVSGSLAAHRRPWLPKSLLGTNDALGPDGWLTVAPDVVCKTGGWVALRQLADCGELPMRQLHRLVKAWRSGQCHSVARRDEEKATKNESDFGACSQRIRTAMGDGAKKHLDEFLAAFGAGLMCDTAGQVAPQGSQMREGLAWLHLLQILPYTVAKVGDGAGEQSTESKPAVAMA